MFSANSSQVSNDANYIEDVFSTYLYTGNSSTQTITNGIDLSTKGGLVWLKNRGLSQNHLLVDTARSNAFLNTNTTDAQTSNSGYSFLSNGFSLTTLGNSNTYPYASWTFRKQPKFFDIVTYTGNSTARTIAHNLGSVPKVIIIKETNASGWWWSVYYGVADKYLKLNTTDAADTSTDIWNNTQPTATEFSIGFFNPVNTTGTNYVAYLFASNAGGFGLTGTDNVISCGSYTGNGTTTGPDVNLGYEPQFLMVKNASAVGSWFMWDSMRGITADGAVQNLTANAANAETTSSSAMSINATGFSARSGVFSGSGSTYIYIAIRRGPMKVPTDATKVFLPTTYTSPGLNVQSTVTTNFPIDLNICGARTENSGYTYKFWFTDRLRVSSGTTTSNSLLTAGGGGTAAETTYNGLARFYFDRMSSYQITDSNGSFNGRTTSDTTFGYDFRRAPSFFDGVCYTGTGSTTAYTHNLGVPPELMIVKSRNDANDWAVYAAPLGNTANLRWNTTAASSTALNLWASTTPSATTFTTNGTYNLVGGGGITYAAYLFATCAGVSKVGSYTGNGTTQTINCGFTGGARFVLIKRTDSTGDWYVYDTARGMTVLTDPYLLLNSTAAESATLGSVTTVSTGFAVNASILAAINTNAASYIFLAIA